MTGEVPASRAARACRTVAWIACADSGAGMVPSDRAKATALAKTSAWSYASASIRPASKTWLTSGADPW